MSQLSCKRRNKKNLLISGMTIRCYCFILAVTDRMPGGTLPTLIKKEMIVTASEMNVMGLALSLNVCTDFLMFLVLPVKLSLMVEPYCQSTELSLSHFETLK